MAISADRESQFLEQFQEYSRTLDCVHCGLCIPYCPTHGVTGRESDSPRGRIYLMRGYAEDALEFTPEVNRHLEQCIVCRACETVCPSGIRMGDMMEGFRHEMNALSGGGISKRFGAFLLRHVLPFRGRIAFLSDLLYLYQRSGLARLISALIRRLSGRLAAIDHLQPVVPPPSQRRIPTDRRQPRGYPAQGKPRVRVGLFLGCIASEWFAPVHRATIQVLQRNGCDVVLPDEQTCCGALHRHAGYLKESHELFRTNEAAFAKAQVDVIVVNAAGCGACLKEPPPDQPDGFSAPVRDICEFLHEIGLRPPRGRLEKRVAYDQPCHLLHGQGVGSSVVEDLLRQIPGLELVPLVDSDRCCGSGGVYNLLHPEMAEPIRTEKCQHIADSGAEIVATGNPGCAMQIRSGLKDPNVEVIHPVELLERAYQAEADDS
jgi:glycolate oxidase iron-sulfur subunit